MDITDLYRTIIMDHYANPRNKGLINNDKYDSVIYKNPSCGDEIVMQFFIDDKILVDIRHEGKGCSICCASASVLCECLKNKSVFEAKKVLNDFREMMQGKKHDIEDNRLLAFQGVAKFPARIKCATLAWQALERGIDEEN